MSLIGAPLPSATYAGAKSGYYAPRDAGGSLVGVTSLNALIGPVAITGDASIGVTTPGLGAVEVSTAGKPQNVGAVTCASLATSGTAAVGALTAATVNSAGTVSAAGFSNASANTPVPFNIAVGGTYNAGLSASLVTVLPAAVAGLSAFKVLKLSVSALNIGYGAPGGNTYWWAITNGLLTNQPNANVISGNSVKFMETLVNAGSTQYTFDLTLPYTSATWPAAGLMFFINASAGGSIDMTASIVGVL